MTPLQTEPALLNQCNSRQFRRDQKHNTGKKVLYITSQTPYGSGEVWALEEMLALLEAGVDLSVLPRTASGNVFHPKAQVMMKNCISLPLFSATGLTVSIGSFSNTLTAVQYAFQKSADYRECVKNICVLPKAAHAARLLKDRGISHIHAHSTTTVAVLGWALAQRLNCPFSFTLHSSFPLENPNLPLAIIRKQFQTLSESASFIRTISATIARKLIRLVGEKYTDKVIPLPLGVDCQVPCPIARTRQEFVILMPAVLMAHKGHRYAVEAARILVERGVRNLRWICCGDGALRSEIEIHIARAGLTGFIEMWGNVVNDRILAMYSNGEVDAVALPCVAVNGIHEGIPHALMQAMSYRIPVISTDSGSTLELIGDGAGMFVPQRDPLALADAIHRLILDSSFRAAQGERGFQRVYSRFNKREILRTLTQLLNQ